MALSTPGIGSGLDISGIVDKLMAIEQAPLSKINTKLVGLQAQVSAYGSLKSAVSSFRDAVSALADASKFKVFSATSSDVTKLTASASSAAGKGVYNVEVVRLAENHRMAASTTYADTSSATVGASGDSMTLTVGSNTFTVGIGGKTLAAVRDAINTASDNKGVTASILKDDSGYHLSLSANDTGSSHALAVSYSGTDPFALNTLNTDRNTSGSFTAADLDASVKLENTFTVTSSSNTLTDSVEGVTLNLVAVGTTTVKVDRNTAGIQSSVQAMTKAYSSLISTMAKMKGDVLKTDTSAVSNMADQLRNVLSTNVSVGGSFSNAFQIGISTQKTGTLALDSTVLNNAITNDPEGFASLFSDTTNGLAVRLTQLADRFLATNGVLDGRSQGLDSAIQSANAQKERLTQRLTVVKARLTKQYNSLDSLVSGLQRTGNLVTQQLDTLTAAQRK